VAETGCRGISARGQVVMAHGGLHMRPVFRAEEVDDRGRVTDSLDAANATFMFMYSRWTNKTGTKMTIT
jgi:hypothetical protein